ncbi:MAG: bifunctional riboflavin kinase/FAD synthetase [Thermodesulfobacteriota bacterium]
MRYFPAFPGGGGLKTVCALGNFDGVHLGHKKIIAALKEKAALYGVESCAITFDPHPQKMLRNKNIHLLMPFEERLRRLEKSGVDITVRLEFSKELSLLSPERFIREIMVGKAGVAAMVVGPRFGFGNKREGNVEMLEELGKKFGFETVVLEPAMAGDTRVSSTRIRGLVLEGKTDEASRLLGYGYYVKGVVTEGEKRGREIGFPTVNLETEWEILPKPGVYATRTKVDGDVMRESITNIGNRPTFGGGGTVMESHLLDTSGDFYGRGATVEFVRRVRDERKFGSGSELASQIEKDIKRVRELLKTDGRRKSG